MLALFAAPSCRVEARIDFPPGLKVTASSLQGNGVDVGGKMRRATIKSADGRPAMVIELVDFDAHLEQADVATSTYVGATRDFTEQTPAFETALASVE